MKRIVIGLLFAALVLFMTACGQSETKPSSKDDDSVLSEETIQEHVTHDDDLQEDEMIYGINDSINCIYRDGEQEQTFNLEPQLFNTYESFEGITNTIDFSTKKYLPKPDHIFVDFSYNVVNTSVSPLSIYVTNFEKSARLYGSDGSIFSGNSDTNFSMAMTAGYYSVAGRSDFSNYSSMAAAKGDYGDVIDICANIPSQGWVTYHLIFEVPRTQFENNEWEVRIENSSNKLTVDGKPFTITITDDYS